MTAQDRHYEPSFRLLRAFDWIADWGSVCARSWASVTLASVICLSNSMTTADAGFVLQSASFSGDSQPEKTTQTWTDSSSQSMPTLWLDSHSGAGAWDEETAISSHTVPNWPGTPSGPFSIVSAGTAGLAAGPSRPNLTSPPESSGGNSASGTFGSHVRLPISLLRYQMQQREFLFLPGAPPFELFHPS